MTRRMQYAQGEQSGGMCTWLAEALGGAAEGSYEQEAAVVVEQDEEIEREDERGVAKRPGPNELDVPEWAELALDKVEWRELLQRIGLWRWRQWAAQAERSD
jgi:hypothetical protein